VKSTAELDGVVSMYLWGVLHCRWLDDETDTNGSSILSKFFCKLP